MSFQAHRPPHFRHQCYKGTDIIRIFGPFFPKDEYLLKLRTGQELSRQLMIVGDMPMMIKDFRMPSPTFPGKVLSS
jgi:hypothetical protein